MEENKPLLSFSFCLDHKYGSFNANQISTGMFRPSANVRGVFMEMKKRVQDITQMWIDSEKPAPLPTPVKEYFYVGGPSKRKFDPVNWHPTEKIVVDKLVKNGLLEDDDYKRIPEVTFKALPEENRGHFEFKIEFFPYKKDEEDRDLFTTRSEK